MSSYQQDTNQTDGQDVPPGFNDVENTVFSAISVTSLSIDAGNTNKTNVGAALATAIAGAQAAVDSFFVGDYIVEAADLPSVADEGNMVVESLFYVSGMNPRLFLGTDASGVTDFVAHDTANNMYENNAYVTDEVYLDMNSVNSTAHPDADTTYIKLGAVMAAMKGLLTAVLTIDPVKKSLHKMAYTVVFDVDAGINVQVEDYSPDVILRGPSLKLETNVGVLISDDTSDNVTPTPNDGTMIVNFFVEGNIVSDIQKTGDSSGSVLTEGASAYPWLNPGISTNTLLKGLFGELLAESPIVSAFRDSNLNDIVAEDLFELVVKRPGKIITETQFMIPTSGANPYDTNNASYKTYSSEYTNYVNQNNADESWLNVYFEYEHNQLMTELSRSFKNIWEDSDNIDWYMTLFNIKETSRLFGTDTNTPDIFRVPVDITLRYELVDNSRDVNTLEAANAATASGSSLSPCDIKITNLIAADVPVIERTFRLEYQFNVTNI